jgi:hypothetical protein
MANKPKKPVIKSGPKAELFKIDGINWQQAIKKSFAKKKPVGGWPK